MVDTTQARRNAAEAGRHMGAPGWYSGFLIACSAENKDKIGRDPTKLGVKVFSRESHLSEKTVTATLTAWNAAYKDNVIPWSTDEMTPEDAINGIEFDPKVHTYESWLGYFDSAAAPHRAKNNENKQSQTRKKKTTQIAKEIETDPEAEKVARKAIAKKDREEWEAKRAKAAEELAEAELQAMVVGGRIPTDEELQPKSTKLSVMADALEAEAEIIGAIEKLPKLAKEMQEVLRKVVDYGSIPDNGGVALSQMQEFYKTIQACVWEAAPMIPEESEAR